MVELLEDLNQSMAKNTDVLVSMSKENGQRHTETTKSIETMSTLLNTWHKGDDRADRPSNPSYPTSSHRPSPRRDGCFYCWGPGHFIANCEFLATDVAEGKVESMDNGARFDMKKVPREPYNVSPKDRVEQQWNSRRQLVAEDFSEDSIVNLVPTQSSLVMLQSDRDKRDKRDELVLELQEKARRATEERDMWKAMTGARQANMSAPSNPQVPQSVPQAAVQPNRMSAEPNATEMMSMLARMLSLSTTNQDHVEKGFSGAQ